MGLGGCRFKPTMAIQLQLSIEARYNLQAQLGIALSIRESHLHENLGIKFLLDRQEKLFGQSGDLVVVPAQ